MRILFSIKIWNLINSFKHIFFNTPLILKFSKLLSEDSKIFSISLRLFWFSYIKSFTKFIFATCSLCRRNPLSNHCDCKFSLTHDCNPILCVFQRETLSFRLNCLQLICANRGILVIVLKAIVSDNKVSLKSLKGEF